MTDTFEFTGDFLKEAERNMAKYPPERKQSAVLARLFLAQQQNRENGCYVTEAAMRRISEMLEMPYIRVMEVATFFTMVNLEPVGQFHIQLCGTTPCMLRGAEDLSLAIADAYGIESGETTADGVFTLTEVECLGACCNAPMVQINDDYYEDLTEESAEAILNALRNGETPKPGSQIERRSCEPVTGLTSLTGKSGESA